MVLSLDGFLAGCVIGMFFETFAPDLLDGAARIKACNELVGGRADAEVFVRERILENVPAFAAEVLAADPHSSAQADALVRDAVPGFAKG